MRKIPPTNLFRIIINPHSFSQSVENMFYLSFLIRDGKVSLDIDEDTGEPIIRESTIENFVVKSSLCGLCPLFKNTPILQRT